MEKSIVKPGRPGLVLIGLSALSIASTGDAKNWGAWSTPVSIDGFQGSSSQINTPGVDGCPSLSPDGLELYITSARPGGLGGVDIWMASRSSTSEGFGAPVNLGPEVNSTADEFCATMTPGGRLYFGSRRHEAAPGGDIYVVRRGPQGWGEVERLGSNINHSGSIEESPAFYEDEQGRTVMYFSSNRSGRNQIYYSVDFGPSDLAEGGATSNDADARPGVRKDGLEIFWDSTRFGGGGGTDLWTATRSSTSQQWVNTQHLAALSAPGPSTFFGPGFDARPFLSWDGTTLIFGSNRVGGEGLVDIYISTREKITGN